MGFRFTAAARASLIFLWSASYGTAQNLAFDAATVKPSKPDAVSSNLNTERDGLRWENARLTFVIQFAYRLSEGSEDQLLGGPAWMRSARFDIEAKEDPQTAAMLDSLPFAAREAKLREMMQSLLAERFGLQVHREARQLTVLALTVGKSGSMLKPAANVGEGQWSGLHNDGEGHVEGRAIEIGPFVNVLSSTREVGGRLVVDQTGLTGSYDFKLTYAPEREGGPVEGPGLFAALQEQLGLRLTANKAPVSCVVVDRITMPTAN